MMKYLFCLVLLLVSFSASAEYRAAIFLPHSSAFWDRLANFAEAAADDIGLELDIYLAEGSADQMLNQVRQASENGVDAIIFMEYKGIGELILKIAEQHQIPALLYNTGLDNTGLLPRVHYKKWLGSIVPDDRKAGMRLAMHLLEKAENLSPPPFQILAYTGAQEARSHSRRVEGMKAIVDAREDVFLVDTIPSIRKPEQAAPFFEQALKQHPEINIVWSISDMMALAAAESYLENVSNKSIVFGGIDWNPKGIKAVETEKIDIDIGGHFFDGAQAVVMIYDYLNGKDFAESQLVFDSNMVAINVKNSVNLQGIMSDPSVIDYRELSKAHNKQLKQYRFDLDAIAASLNHNVFFTTEEQLFISQHPVIEIGVDGNWPPIDFMDDQGAFSGIAADYLNIISTRTGIQFKPVKSNTFKVMLNKVIGGELSIGSTISYKKERAEKLIFTQPFFNVKKVIVVNKDEHSIHEIDDLKGKTVVVEDGFLTMRQLQERHPDIKLLPVKNSLSAIQQLSWGKADAYIGNQSVSAWLIREQQISNLHFVGDPGLGGGPQNYAISKQVPNGQVLQSIIDKVLRGVSVKERYAIEQAWLDDPSASLAKKYELNLTGAEKQWLQAHPLLNVGIDPAWPPVEYFDDEGVYQGMASDVLALIAKRLSIDTEVAPGLTWPQVHAEIKNTQLDMLPAVSRTHDREKYLNFTQPYIEFPQVIFTQNEASFFLNGLGDLSGRTVVVEKGYVAQERLARDWPEIILKEASSTVQALKILAAGEADAYVGNLTIGSYLITENGLSNIKIAAPTPYANQLTMGVRKDWPELIPILQKAINSIDARDMAAIRQKWMSVRYDHQVDYRLLINISLLAILILGLMFFWNRQIKKHSDALSRGEERLRLTLESANLGSWELFLEGRKVKAGHWNETFEDHHHITDASTLSTLEGFLQNIAEDDVDKLNQTFKNYIEGETQHFSYEYLTLAGNWILMEGRIFAYDKAERPSRIIGITRDITHGKQLKEMEKQLTKKVMKSNALLDAANHDLVTANKKLQEMDRLKSMFIASISHELRTPLNSIIGFSSMMARGTFGELGPKYSDYIQRINRSGQHLLALITDIIDISKIESGRVDVIISEFNVMEVVDEAVSSLRAQIESKGIELSVDVPPELLLTSDRRRVFQCILNLLSNAYKYSEQGLIAINVQSYEGQVKINVSDTGIGIAETDQARLFEAFERIDSHLRIKAGGTGLGLYLTKKIITDILGGEISVSSQVHQGSDFLMTLPQKLLVDDTKNKQSEHDNHNKELG